ncbi:glucose-6-phosphate isomerase [Lutibaculum baratangense]|uniref:Glucose-6-phosphate isomerase n=1 Tax=Lutibaculum baratangense AMV1 TaxID=631454 RepID=V4RWW3_9HYPH|nr:glucose-6-phosphate isomerase [Lutibaculum baratangense]ESR27500.1 Glucose-6-phosphate isomerase [Lutibaculum baratangense AMV1]
MLQHIDYCFEVEVGERGLGRDEFETVLQRAEPGVRWLREAHETNALPLLRLPAKEDDLAEIAEAAAWLADGTSDVVILGTGGSSLGGQTLAQVGGWRLPVIGDFRQGPRLHFLDNLDGSSFEAALRALPLATTKVLAVSKSGGTGETLMQVMAICSAYEDAGLGGTLADHLMGLSEPVHSGALNKLRKILEPAGVRILPHDPGVGGRFAALTNVGLIPAAIAGLDPAAVRRGAAKAFQPVIDGSRVGDIPAVAGAALAVAFAEARAMPMDVMLAYSDRLERFTRWWVQLWSESLGKQGRGMTPVPAVGPVDQHSQLQLFLDGPADKFVTVITTDCRGTGPRIDAALAAEAGQPEFGGRTMGDFVAAQQKATADTLARNGKPVRILSVESVDAEAIGELMMHYMLETIVAAHLLGVDAFDQPAVEEGKVLARTYLSES